MPPPKDSAVFPLTVLLVRVRMPSVLEMPPPLEAEYPFFMVRPDIATAALSMLRTRVDPCPSRARISAPGPSMVRSFSMSSCYESRIAPVTSSWLSTAEIVIVWYSSQSS